MWIFIMGVYLGSSELSSYYKGQGGGGSIYLGNCCIWPISNSSFYYNFVNSSFSRITSDWCARNNFYYCCPQYGITMCGTSNQTLERDICLKGLKRYLCICSSFYAAPSGSRGGGGHYGSGITLWAPSTCWNFRNGIRIQNNNYEWNGGYNFNILVNGSNTGNYWNDCRRCTSQSGRNGRYSVLLDFCDRTVTQCNLLHGCRTLPFQASTTIDCIVNCINRITVYAGTVSICDVCVERG